MLGFICPVCGKPLWDVGASLRCPDGHSYDKAKKGYVNLLMSNTSAKKRHGDDRLMVASRRDFLNKGYFSPLLNGICRMAENYTPPCAVSLLDAGCGEGYYTAGVKDALERAGLTVDAFGLDISRDALSEAHRRDSAIHLAVAGINRLPVPEGECDILLNIFAPHFPMEFARVLSPRGILIRVVPLERHLFGLKAQIYDKPYENSVPPPDMPPLHLIETQVITYQLTLNDSADILSLFKMTPYYYKTSAFDQAKLLALDHLETELEFGIWVYAVPPQV
ncbi:MAG: putative RNA methyltransferase [Oscillospiraceae bacterium]